MKRPVKALRNTLVSMRDLLISAGPLALLAIGLLVLAYWWLNPNPPKKVTLATGPAQSAYEEFGKRYQQALKRYGIQVVLVPSEGSRSNLRLLKEGKADGAFVQGGSGDANANEDSGILSLGSLFVEPLWLFYREDAAKNVPGGTLTSLTQLKDLRVNIGARGSGSPGIMRRQVAREGTHPALLQLFAQAAHDLHGPAGWFNKAGSFPNIEHSEYPVATEADRTIRVGKPFLQRWLPFWLANLVERMWLALGIIVAVLLPLSRIVPPLYQFRIRSRVFRWYGQLRDIEARLQDRPGEGEEFARELDALDERVGRISVPLSYADELYALRNNIDAVRRRARSPAITEPAGVTL